MTIRWATRADIPAMVDLVYELAEYERAREQCTLTTDQLEHALFGPAPSVFAHVAEVDRVVVGTAIWFLNFSTWDGVNGIYLEDLYVTPACRSTGLGTRLLAALAAECVSNGYSRLSWAVLDWNEPSIAFYRSLGAVAQDEWTTYRLTGAALRALAIRPGPTTTTDA